MRRLLFILCLLPMLGFSQALQRQFFTTNTAPNVVVTAGTNAFITFSLVGQQRTYRIDTPASGTATNIVWPVQGTNVFLTTNGLAIVIDVPSPLIPWQAITNITSIQIPAAAVTNAPWSLTGQTNLALTIAGTNVFVHSTTNLGVTTYTIDVPLQPQQTNWSWQSITNIATVQIPYSAITNPPAAGGQTNLALVVSGTNVFVSSVTNLGVTTFTIDVPATAGGGQTNVTLVVQGTNTFVHSTTNSGVITYTIDVPTYVQTNIAWQAVTNISTVQIPYTSITNAPWSTTGQTNLALVVAGTNAFVTPVTNLGVTTFTVDGPAIRTQWSVATITNAGTAAYSNSTAFVLSPTNSQWSNSIIVATSPTTSEWTQDASILTNVNNLSQSLSNYIINLVANVNRDFYFSAVTNALGVGTSTNCSTMIDVPVAATATNSVGVPTAGVYFLSRVSTNTVTRIEDGPIQLQTYIYVTGAGGNNITAHPEMWIWFTNNTMVQIASSGPQTFTKTAGDPPQIFNTTMNVSTATNLTGGAHLLLRWKADGVTGNPTWNFVIGGVYDSHISVNVANQSGTYVGDFVGDGNGITNIPQSSIVNQTPRVVGITIDGGGSAITSGTKGFLEVPYAATIQSGTILADQVGSIQIETWRTNSGNLTLLARAGSLGTNWLTTTNWQRDMTLTGWSSVAIASNDILGFTVTTNAASVTRATLQLKLQP